jgi:protein tyrosine phosphatase (PTP) superfamily phosphohydrolase (DUF442 family)
MSPLEKIHRYRAAGPTLATSGQPTEEQLKTIAATGYQVVINLALHNDPRYSLQDEAKSVQALGLEYVHIPVEFAAPTPDDLERFFAAMEVHKAKRIWVHCAANYRVTAFVGLHRCLREGQSEADAFALMRDVWQPNEIWSQFIASQLRLRPRLPDSQPSEPR